MIATRATCATCGTKPVVNAAVLGPECADCIRADHLARLSPAERDILAILDSSFGATTAATRGTAATVDQSPEAVAARKAAKAAEAEAIAYVAAYTGTWGLPLDIRASAKWGTAYMSLTPRQVEVLLAGKARDAARQAPVTAADPRTETAWAFLATITNPREGFEADMVARASRRWAFSVNQLAAVERWAERAGTPRVSTAAVAATGPVTDGMYRVGEDIFKVQKAVNGSGHLYAKRLIVDGTTGRFEYEAGAIRRLTTADKMTLEDAAAFGKLYGVCCVCGRTLTDEESIAAGIGPVCGHRMKEWAA